MRGAVGAWVVAFGVLVVATSSVAAPHAAATAAARATVSVPASVDATGRTDVTDALNRLFAAAPPGATVALGRGARYRVEGVLDIANHDGLTIEGDGATIFATTDGRATTPPPGAGYRSRWPRLRRHLAFRASRNVAVRNLTIVGPNRRAEYRPDLEGQAAIGIVGTDTISISAVTVRAVYGDAVYIAGGSTNVDIARSTFAQIGRQGVAVVAASNVAVRETTFEGITRSVLDIEPVGRKPVVNVALRAGSIGAFGGFLLSIGGSPRADVSDVRVEQNVVRAGHGLAISAGVARTTHRGLQIVDNTSRVVGSLPPTATQGELMHLVNLDGVTITGNVQPMRGGTVIGLDAVCNTTIAGNQFPGAARPTVQLAPCGAQPTSRPTSAPKPSRSKARPPASARGAATTPSRDHTDDGIPPWAIVLAIGSIVGAVVLIVVARRRARTPT